MQALVKLLLALLHLSSLDYGNASSRILFSGFLARVGCGQTTKMGNILHMILSRHW